MIPQCSLRQEWSLNARHFRIALYNVSIYTYSLCVLCVVSYLRVLSWSKHTFLSSIPGPVVHCDGCLKSETRHFSGQRTRLHDGWRLFLTLCLRPADGRSDGSSVDTVTCNQPVTITTMADKGEEGREKIAQNEWRIPKSIFSTTSSVPQNFWKKLAKQIRYSRQ